MAYWAFFYINRISNDTDKIIKNNYETLVYNNNILHALDLLPQNKQAIDIIEKNLQKQEHNITEPGEGDATTEVRKSFEQLKLNPLADTNYKDIRENIQKINELNQAAILRKNAVAKQTAEDASFWLMIIFTFLTLIAFTAVFNIPAIIAKPIAAISDGIKEISRKNYGARIHLKQDDEFGELIDTFNMMAIKLDEYEHSNLAKLQMEKMRIEAIINQMKDGIIGLDAKRNILFMNAVAEKLLGLKEAESIGKYVVDIALHNDLMRTLLNQQTATELKIYADNKESYFSKEVVSIEKDNSVLGEVIVLKNVTLFHELNVAKTNFIATVSHELKTPIASIKMSSQLLNDDRVGKLNEDQKDLLKSINDDAERLLKITGELLNISQVETGNIQLKLQLTNPSSITEQALAAVHFQAQQKAIHIQTNIHEPLSDINVDAEKTSWVLVNLLTNAIKFSPEQSVINLEVKEVNELIIFSVTDKGKGIEEKYLHKIFDRYFKVPGQAQTGTGLGLAISKDFIEAQGGSIGVKSSFGEGSTFAFQIPAFRKTS